MTATSDFNVSEHRCKHIWNEGRSGPPGGYKNNATGMKGIQEGEKTGVYDATLFQ